MSENDKKIWKTKSDEAVSSWVSKMMNALPPPLQVEDRNKKTDMKTAAFAEKKPRPTSVKTVTFAHVVYVMCDNYVEKLNTLIVGLKSVVTKSRQVETTKTQPNAGHHIIAIVYGKKEPVNSPSGGIIPGMFRWSLDNEDMCNLLGYMSYYSATVKIVSNASDRQIAGLVMLEYFISNVENPSNTSEAFYSRTLLSAPLETGRDLCLLANKLGGTFSINLKSSGDAATTTRPWNIFSKQFSVPNKVIQPQSMSGEGSSSNAFKDEKYKMLYKAALFPLNHIKLLH